MASQTVVRITKIGEADAARVRAGDWKTYIAGGGPLNTTSLPVDYEMEGVILDPPIPGQSMRVFRFSRNGVEVPGLFATTEIVRVIVVTQNSVYRLERTGPRQDSSAG